MEWASTLLLNGCWPLLCYAEKTPDSLPVTLASKL